MRHRKIRSKLSMMTARRDATLKNMVRSLVKHQSINTTLARAKVARRFAEKLITLSKTDTVEARRRAFAVLGDHDLVVKLFKEVSPLSKDRTSGFTRIIKLGFRLGDGAEMAILELTDKKIIEKLPKKKTKARTSEGTKHGSSATKEAGKEYSAPAHDEHKETKIKTIPKTKPTLAEEKRTEKARAEDKKVADKRGFMKNLRGLFRKRGDF